MSTGYWLTNVRLESGFCLEHGEVVGTTTENCRIRIENGVIAEIVSSEQPIETELPCLDGEDLLLLPAFREMHIHLDKTYYGGPWQACMPATSVFDRIKEEEELLLRQLPTAQARAEALIQLVAKHGATHIRTHCNIDPVVGLRNLAATKAALAGYEGVISSEIVAFPQHGLLRSESVALMKAALQEGATIVGGVDPATVDENIEKSLNTIIELAVASGSGVDLHLHDGGQLGIHTMRQLAALVVEARLQGKAMVSHAFALADVAPAEAADVAAELAYAGIGIASTVPIDMPTIPIPLLHEKGVSVCLGNDSITDHWDPFGTGDLLQKASRMAERFGWSDERSLAEALGFITGGKKPLSPNGERVWPAVGDEASMVLVQASCAAEAVARRAKRRAVLAKGQVISGSIRQAGLR
ncbi:deaminase [Brevibacillus fluminis]|uniref:Deaminase n=1 Tax=Brevibacillus fluminis TaxID=511487 RepID=A0A3M8DS15_9BACL|nr:amidohydrolase [Brevibacillus fluminis]RNB90684.1 deaminase [Brevibacillus fluminis]